MLLRYASHIPAHTRLGRAVADDERLAWVFPFLAAHDQADILVTGGAARDLYLGHAPHELHLVVRGVPLQQVERFFARRGSTERHDHGLHVQPSGTMDTLDVSLPRTDVYHPRHKAMRYQFHHSFPQSHDDNWRDVSMNAMSYSVRDGVFRDPYRGLHALDRGSVVALGHPLRRFAARPLHALRALRLAGNFRLTPDSPTWEAIYRTLPQLSSVHFAEDGHQFTVPRAALGRELLRFFTREAGTNWNLLRSAGGTQFFFGDVARNYHGPVLQSLTAAGSTLSTLFAALAYPHGTSTPLNTWANRWQLSRHPDLLRGQHLAHQLQRLSHVHPQDLRPTDVLRLFPANNQQELHTLGNVLLAHNVMDGEQARRLAALKRLHVQYAWRSATAPRLRGRDLLAQGYAPGPELRLVLRSLRDQQLAQ